MESEFGVLSAAQLARPRACAIATEWDRAAYCEAGLQCFSVPHTLAAVVGLAAALFSAGVEAVVQSSPQCLSEKLLFSLTPSFYILRHLRRLLARLLPAYSSFC